MFDEVIIIIIIIVFIIASTFSPQTMVAVLESLLVRMEQYANNLEVVIIFVLTIDPFLRMMANRFPSMTIGGYADDNGMGIDCLVSTLPTVLVLFELFAGASGLQLKPKKCVVVPCGSLLRRM